MGVDKSRFTVVCEIIILVLFINKCIIYYTNNYKPTFAHLCVCVPQWHSQKFVCESQKDTDKKNFKFTKKPAYLGGRVDMPIN